MTLAPGTRLGYYDILTLIGSGGMGEVYRVRDTKLNRDVAIKVLPDLFSRDPDRLARFTREAQVLASLNHPHIAIIHGLDESRWKDAAAAGHARRRATEQHDTMVACQSTFRRSRSRSLGGDGPAAAA
jgi:serine/threonine protein kinase